MYAGRFGGEYRRLFRWGLGVRRTDLPRRTRRGRPIKPANEQSGTHEAAGGKGDGTAEPREPAQADSGADRDREPVSRFKQGDKTAFDLLYTRYQLRIFSLIRRFLHDPDDVQDVAQEVFLKALRGLPRFREESAFYTWLYRIAVNTAKNHIVAMNRRPPDVYIDAVEVQVSDGTYLLRDSDDPAASLSRDELSVAIQCAMSGLSDKLRHALVLREIEGKSYRQIAALLDCPVGTVRSRIFRARKAIDEQIGPLLG